MAASKKAAGYLQQLQQALRNERYNEVPELSRKVRKHDPSRICFARSAEVQASLVKQLRISQDVLDDANFNDLSGTFHWLKVDVEQLSSEKTLLEEAYAAHKSATQEDIAFYDLANFFYGLLTRQLIATTRLENHLSTNPHNPFLSQSLAMRGILEELRGQRGVALREYESFPCPDMTSTSFESPIWLEHIMYRKAILSPTPLTQKQFIDWQAQHGRKSSGKNLHVLSTQPRSELYAAELLRSTRFPSAEATNSRLLSMVTDTLEPWINDGCDPLQAERHLDLLYEAGAKTFHSPRVLRYMIRALAALERHEEVFLALDAYLQISLHAQKTKHGADVDSPQEIVSTVHFVVSRLLKEVSCDYDPAAKAQNLYERSAKVASSLNIQDAACISMLEEMRGTSTLLHYRESHEPTDLVNALECFDNATAPIKSTDFYSALAIVHIQKGDISNAMINIRSALEQNQQDVSALLVFANLLCCEELYDRALMVVARALEASSQTKDTFASGLMHIKAKIVQLKIVEQSCGAAKALEKSSELLAAYRHYLEPPHKSSHTLQNGGQQPLEISKLTRQNGTSATQNSSQAPSIRIDPPSTTSSPAFLAPAILSNDNSNGTTVNGFSHPEARTGPPSNNDRLRAVSGPARSSSLKSSQPARHFGQHLHLRKSASVRSLRNTNSIEHSSRSSSPLNHPAPSIRSILPESVVPQDEIIMDRQLTALELQEKRRKSVLADIWLYIAHLCRAASAGHSEIEQAIEEARALIGPTPAILSMQLEVRRDLALAHGPVSSEDVRVIEEGYEYALTLDDEDETTILSFTRFLLSVKVESVDPFEVQLRRERVARAYEMLESLKASPSAMNPQLWHLSAEVAMEMEEYDRAEQDSWRAIEASDAAGVEDWFKLW